MRTFTPVKLFFHVQDKFVPSFIRHDPDCPPGPARLYEHLFAACKDRNRCCVSQETLAVWEKKTPRSLQSYLATLVRLGDIHIEKTPTGRNVYYLLLSDRLLGLLFKLGTPLHGFSPCRPEAMRHFDSDDTACEKISPDLRVNKKKEISPLSPLPKPAAPSPSCHSRTGFPSSAPTTQRVQGRGDSSLPRSGATPSQNPLVLHRPIEEHEFEQLWGVWPQSASWAMPRNRQLALRVYRRMRRAGQLPPIAKLIGIVEQYKRTDSRWLNGYPPECSNWLNGRQFDKTPLVRPKKSFFGKLFDKPDPEPVLTPEERHQAELYRAQVKALHERFTSRTFSATPPLPGDDADALISLWPEPERQRVPVTGFLRYLAGQGKKLDVGQLVPLAREYLDSTASPMSLAGWLRQHVGGAYAAI